MIHEQVPEIIICIISFYSLLFLCYVSADKILIWPITKIVKLFSLFDLPNYIIIVCSSIQFLISLSSVSFDNFEMKHVLTRFKCSFISNIRFTYHVSCWRGFCVVADMPTSSLLACHNIDGWMNEQKNEHIWNHVTTCDEWDYVKGWSRDHYYES